MLSHEEQIHINNSEITTCRIKDPISGLFLKRNVTSCPCHQSYPDSGRWTNQKPYWKFRGCPSRLFNSSDALNCLSGRTVYIAGHSVTRQYGFTLLQLLGGDAIDRNAQKALCSKSMLDLKSACHRLFKDVTIKYLFLHYMDGFNYSTRGGFPYVFANASSGSSLLLNRSTPNEVRSMFAGEETGELYPTDVCTPFDSVKDCYTYFFANSTKKDVFIFQLGGPYAFSSKVIDVERWARESAKAFAANLRDTFKGQVVRVTTTPTHFERQHSSGIRKQLEETFWDVWKPQFGGSKSSAEWMTIDQYAINRGRKRFYNDAIHFAGPLADATIQQLLTMTCPSNLGVDAGIVDLASYDDHDIFGKVVINDDQYYIAGEGGELWRIKDGSDSHPCVKYVGARFGTIKLSNHEMQGFPIEQHFAIESRICSDGALIQNATAKSVYRFLNGTLIPFGSGKEFLAQGFSFENIISLAPNIFEMIFRPVSESKDWGIY